MRGPGHRDANRQGWEHFRVFECRCAGACNDILESRAHRDRVLEQNRRGVDLLDPKQQKKWTEKRWEKINVCQTLTCSPVKERDTSKFASIKRTTAKAWYGVRVVGEIVNRGV